jgi:hypothetical protein
VMPCILWPERRMPRREGETFFFGTAMTRTPKS